MTAALPTMQQIEKKLEDGLSAAGFDNTAEIAKTATWIICECLIGCDVGFNRGYRDQKIYEDSVKFIEGENRDTQIARIAAAYSLTPRQIRNIVKKQIEKRRENGRKIHPPASPK
jgi:hypothetical protein